MEIATLVRFGWQQKIAQKKRGSRFRVLSLDRAIVHQLRWPEFRSQVTHVRPDKHHLDLRQPLSKFVGGILNIDRELDESVRRVFFESVTIEHRLCERDCPTVCQGSCVLESVSKAGETNPWAAADTHVNRVFFSRLNHHAVGIFFLDKLHKLRQGSYSCWKELSDEIKHSFSPFYWKQKLYIRVIYFDDTVKCGGCKLNQIGFCRILLYQVNLSNPFFFSHKNLQYLLLKNTKCNQTICLI